MKLLRRDWLRLAGAAACAAALPRLRAAAPAPLVREFEQPLFDLPSQVREPVIVESVELLRRDSHWFVRTRTRHGAAGLTGTKQVEDFVPLFERLVAPHFVGRDARDLETLIDEVYRANYKLVGLPFWCCVAYIEQSLLDLLGRVAGCPVAALLGGRLREEIPVYLSGSARELSADEEVAIYVRGVAETGARAVKFKIGGRMSRNLDAAPGRTERLVRLARERLGPDVVLSADANGSYDPATGIAIGRQLEELGYAFFEEPCPFEELSETRAVADALRIPVAGGEQDASLWRFHWMVENGVVEIVQPDLNYNGGLIRARRVARIAAKFGRTIVPHNTQTGPTSANILQFAASTPNTGPFMEYPWRAPQRPPGWYQPDFRIRDGRLRVPDGPGMGVTFDPDFVAGATVVSLVDHPARRGSTGSGS